MSVSNGESGPGTSDPVPADAFEPAAAGGDGHKQPRRALRWVSLITLIVLGLGGLGGGGVALSQELTRNATSAEAAAAVRLEIATRWQRLPAGKIFPAAISYQDTQGVTVTARRVGTAPPATCRASLEAGALRKIHSLDCKTMLRATYVHASGTLAATVGIVVMASPSAAKRAEESLDPMRPGIRPAGCSLQRHHSQCLQESPARYFRR